MTHPQPAPRLPIRRIVFPALTAAVVTFAVLAAAPAGAAPDPLSADDVAALAGTACDADPAVPVTVLGETDADVVPGEITVHVVRAEVTTSLGDVAECTFGVLHRDTLLPRVQYAGTVDVTTDGGLASTDVELGNLGKRGQVDPTTAVTLAGVVTPAGTVTGDPSYAVELDRTSVQLVQVGPTKAQKDAATRLLAAQTKAAAQLKAAETRAASRAHGKAREKALAAAQRNYERRIAAARTAYDRATAPKTVEKPVTVHVSVAGTVPLV